MWNNSFSGPNPEGIPCTVRMKKIRKASQRSYTNTSFMEEASTVDAVEASPEEEESSPAEAAAETTEAVEEKEGEVEEPAAQ